MSILGWCFGCGKEVPWLSENTHVVVSFPRPSRPQLFRQVQRVCGPVWPGVRVHDQAEAEEIIPELLRIEAPGHWVEWVPGRGSLSIMQWLVPEFTAHYRDSDIAPSTSVPPNDETGQAVAQLARAVYKEHGHGLIDWLRIAADPDGPPVDIEDVRAVVQAGVPAWIERLGRRWYWQRPMRGSVRLRSGDGSDPAEWPEDLRGCRELPEVSP